MREVPLTQGKVALVDDEDYERVMQYKWQAVYHKETSSYRANRSFYTDGRKRTVYMHRFILQAPRMMEVDHWNHNQLDNQRGNLRLCTRRQNCQNRHKRTGRNPYKGVHEESGKAKPWRAYIRNNGRHIYIGNFADSQQAALAYDRKARELFGNFALTNFPSSGDASPDAR